jgi:DnaJ-class molecular chaperone
VTDLLTAALVVVVLVAVYLLGCRIWPYANCPRCSGSGKSKSPSRKTFRNCPRCKGNGRRRRFGRVLLDRNAARKH